MSYWDEYSNLQHTKHELIRLYLSGWFPKLASWSGRVLYFDTHAGRGRHAKGHEGSPLIALKTLLEHASRPQLLARSEVIFFLIERDEENVAALNAELQAFAPLPEKVKVKTVSGDSFQAIESLLQSLDQTQGKLAPAFVFVDPFGFKVPGSLLRRLMKHERVELFINVMWRELDMAIQQGEKPGMAETLDLIFDGPQWRQRVTALDFDQRADQAVDLLRENIGARWATVIRMLGDNQATRYLLLHLTNHDAGRDLMKDCVWKVCPTGGFYVRKWDNPAQQYLITPEPNLVPLEEWVIEKLTQSPCRWNDLIEAVRPEIWRVAHLNQVIRELRKARRIDGDQYKGKFLPSSNPRLFVTQDTK